MDQLSFGLPSTGSEIHFTWSNGVITLSDKFTGDIEYPDGGLISFENGKFVSWRRAKHEWREITRLPHPCVQNVVAGEDIGVNQMVYIKDEGSLRTAYRRFSTVSDEFSTEEKPLSCKCEFLLHGHESGCPMESK